MEETAAASAATAEFFPQEPATATQDGPDFTFLYSPDVGASVEVPADHEESRKGRKRVQNPDNWKHKHVKKPGLRKNAPCTDIYSLSTCCKKQCLTVLSKSHLAKVRSDFEDMYYEQHYMYLNGLLRRYETKKTSGHKRKANPATTSSGKRLGRPPAEDSKFSFQYYLCDEKGLDMKVCQKAFCCIHGFGPKRLRVLQDKINSAEGGRIVWDKRGKHGSHQKVDDSVCDLI